MKKILLNVKMLSFSALIAGSFAISSCNKCDEPRDDNYGSTNCDEAATVNKFIGNWYGPGSYPFTVTVNTGTDYSINVYTSFGFTNNENNIPFYPIFLNGWSVSQNEATLSSATFYGATLSNAKISYINSTSASVSFTLSDGGDYNVTYTHSLSK